MKPLRLSVRFPAVAPVASLDPAIEVFHRFIQRGHVEGLVLDVADYRHVPQGPGVLLVGHDVDYGLNEEAFTVVRKRTDGDDAATQLRDALRMGLGALQSIEADGALPIAFDQTSFSVSVHDRSLGDPDVVEATLQETLSPVIADLFGSDASVQAAAGDDPRRAPTVAVQADADAAGTVLDKLGGSNAPGQSPWDITVDELARLRESDADFVLLDVREDTEYETVNLGGTHIPLATIGDRLGELDQQAQVIVHCRAGRRGALAVEQLREAGFEDAWNVNGGLMAWIDRIDPSLPRY